MSNLDYYDGGRLVRVPSTATSPFSLDGAPTRYDIEDDLRSLCGNCDDRGCQHCYDWDGN